MPRRMMSDLVIEMQRSANAKAIAFHAGPGRHTSQILERPYEFGPAVRIAGIVEGIHADEDIGRPNHFGPCQSE